MKVKKQTWKFILLFAAVSIVLEILGFNGRAITSLKATNQHPTITREGNSVIVENMVGKPGYIYVGVDCRDEEGNSYPIKVNVNVWDEGNSEGYEAGSETIYPVVEKSKYLHIHSYGEVKKLQLTFENSIGEVVLTEFVYDAKVPFYISLPRVLLMFFVFAFLRMVAPKSVWYRAEWKNWQRRITVGMIIVAHAVILMCLVRANPLFLHPAWPYHQQYAQLAESISQGKFDISLGNEELLAALDAVDNPYDTAKRLQVVPGADSVWDICFYNGKFYVYFGIVPVLLFYLPYYLLFHAAFPTWIGVYLAGIGVFCGTFYLWREICKKWFSNIPYLLYLMIATVMGDGMLLFSAMLRAEFYWLPILMALNFVLWGIGFFFTTLRKWSDRGCNKYLVLSGFCLALTAGCRPQFLVGTFLIIPFWIEHMRKEGKQKKFWKKVIVMAFPYLIIGVGIMYYNMVRFGSVFDFGANYNLTSNDMTKRGVNLERVPEGIFMYLLQPCNLKSNFPFIEATIFYTKYLGTTIREATFGGAFWSHPILLVIACLPGIWKQLRDKGLHIFTLCSLGVAVLVVLSDIEMAGILHRYYMDFLWLLMIPAGVAILQLWEIFTQTEKYKDTMAYKWVIFFLVTSGGFGIFCELMMAIQNTGLQDDNAHLYYLLRTLFQ